MRYRTAPLAWRTITYHRKRFALSIAGITFAAVLMFMQLGFMNAVFDSQVAMIRLLNADFILTNSSKHRLGALEPFGRRRLEQARAVKGVSAVYPLYVEGTDSVWRNPETGELRLLRVIGVSPGDPVFRDESLDGRLRDQDTALIDRRSKDFFGPRHAGVETELAGRRVKVIGSFELGTDFDFDGTVIMSEANFLKFFPAQRTSASDLGRPELGLLRVSPNSDVNTVRADLERSLPPDVRVWTRQELIDQEIFFWRVYTPTGFIFGLGLVVGFFVGVVICSQILFTSVVDRLPQFGTLKALGYRNGFLIRLVISEAVLLAILGFGPSLGIAAALYHVLSSIIGFKMFLSVPRVLLVLAITSAMSIVASLIAVRKAVTANPAELFG
jgi:putative ABC transport system permease protein